MSLNTVEDPCEPSAKKLCLKSSNDEIVETGETSQPESMKLKLEERISLVLSCTVCLDVPISSIFQCSNGHLMCASCLHHLLADSRLRNEMSTCPNCRVDITDSCTRNLAVEKAVSELPIKCRFCPLHVPRFHVQKHQNDECLQRLVSCTYEKIGCHWQGTALSLNAHMEKCAQAKKTGLEIMEDLKKSCQEDKSKLEMYQSLFALFSYGRTCEHDLQLRPKQSEDYIPELYYQSTCFSSFGKDWMIRSQVIGNENNLRRGFRFQLILTTKCNIFVKFIFVRSPHGDVDTKPAIFQHEFTQESPESPEQDLPISQHIDMNKLLAARFVPIRVVMFLGKV